MPLLDPRCFKLAKYYVLNLIGLRPLLSFQQLYHGMFLCFLLKIINGTFNVLHKFRSKRDNGSLNPLTIFALPVILCCPSQSSSHQQ